MLQYPTPLSTALQAPSCDLIRASTQAEKLIGFPSDKRDDAVFFTTIWDTTETLAAKNSIETSIPRIAQRQTHCSNIPASTPFEYWRLNLFLPLIDHLINQLQDRLCKPLTRLNAQYLMPTRLHQLTDDIWRDIKDEYGDLLPSIDTVDAELEMWQHTTEVVQLLAQIKAYLRSTTKATRLSRRLGAKGSYLTDRIL